MIPAGVLSSAQAAAMSDISDSFDIPDVYPWDGTGTDLTWTLQGPWGIYLGAARPENTEGFSFISLAAVSTPLEANNCWAETTQTMVFTNTMVGPAVHLSVGAGYLFCFRASGLVYLYRIENGVRVEVASSPTSTTSAPLRLESYGDTLRCYKDGYLLIEWTDPNPLAKTKTVGIGSVNSNNASRIDTFTAGVL